VAKEGGIESLAEYFPKITHAYLIGEAADDFAKTLKGKVPFTACGTLEKAFHAAVNAAAKNSVVLLSPACASFDQYANFEVRGQAFVALVNAWKKGESTHATAS
jgi:UDP-N-acetylmuramoylalanine--D-glutamate ligase